jgi:hypothetical protein
MTEADLVIDNYVPTGDALVPIPHSDLRAVKEFPLNACRGERCGVWGRRAPIRPVQAIVGNDS